ncbi:MAG: sigma-70 family RNA polymerase sigma factor, partial [Candidatus Dormibacteraeota bacterium]|nr:sigma-70 family RNA polymerase sigma factor [Candidatus Dormibacteraeota bacterium]
MLNDSASDDPTPRDPPAFRSDALLLAEVIARQPAALAELYDRYFPSAYALAVRMLRDPRAAETCVQTVFADLWQHPLGADPTREEWNAALLAAVHRQARTQQRSPLRPPPPAAGLTPPAADLPPSGPGRFAARRRVAEQQQAARTALTLLPLRQRMVLELAYFDGRTAPEIAASLGESRATIDRQLRDGLRQLRTALTPAACPAPVRAARPVV